VPPSSWTGNVGGPTRLLLLLRRLLRLVLRQPERRSDLVQWLLPLLQS
jgi:hypothetical protein